MKKTVPADPLKTNKDLRLSRCYYCGRAKHDTDALFCIMCGRPIVNFCTECSHRNISIARFCEKCGKPTAFLEKGVLLPFNAEQTAFPGYHDPPGPPEGEFTARKRQDDEYKAKRERQKAEQKIRLEEFLKEYDR